MRINWIVILVLLSIKSIFAQYAPPVDFPMVLAGNVGEIRPGHFHTGIDIKASAGVGSAVRATADGFVSRIGVSPTGYGKVLYVSHLDGKMSVYAHLDGFSKPIADWVREQQYAKKSYRVDLYPARTLFAVKQGQTIGFLGNSGSSGGPHLHFEIRDQSSNPLNILSNKSFKVADNIAPNIYRIMLYQCDTIGGAPIYTMTQSIDIQKNRGGEWELSDTVIRASRPSYIAYEVIDYQNGRSNTMGIYSMSQKVAGRENFSFKLDRVSFATTRYVNTLMQWELSKRSKHHFIRAYISPNNALSIYGNVVNRGVIEPPRVGEKIEVETLIADESGNTSRVSFWIEGAPKRVAEPQLTDTHLVVWSSDFLFNDTLMTVKIPRKTLYETSLVKISKTRDVVTVGDDKIATQKGIVLKIKQLVPARLQSKALLVTPDNSSVGGAWSVDGVQGTIQAMGQFRIAFDTIPPTVVAYKLGGGGALKFRISDNLSGISSYQLLIDDRWALGEFDAKTGMLVHNFRQTGQAVKHNILLKVVDNKGNIKITQSTQIW